MFNKKMFIEEFNQVIGHLNLQSQIFTKHHMCLENRSKKKSHCLNKLYTLQKENTICRIEYLAKEKKKETVLY